MAAGVACQLRTEGGPDRGHHCCPGAGAAVDGLRPVGRSADLLRSVRLVPTSDCFGPVRVVPSAGDRPGGRDLVADCIRPGTHCGGRIRRLYRLRDHAGADGRRIPDCPGASASGSAGGLPVAPGGHRLYQRGRPDYRHFPVGQAIGGCCREKRASLRDGLEHAGRGFRVYALADSRHERRGYCPDVLVAEIFAEGAGHSGCGGPDHGGILVAWLPRAIWRCHCRFNSRGFAKLRHAGH